MKILRWTYGESHQPKKNIVDLIEKGHILQYHYKIGVHIVQAGDEQKRDFTCEDLSWVSINDLTCSAKGSEWDSQ